MVNGNEEPVISGFPKKKLKFTSLNSNPITNPELKIHPNSTGGFFELLWRIRLLLTTDSRDMSRNAC